MKDSPLTAPTYPLKDLVSVFSQGPFPDLLGFLTILTEVPDVRSSAHPRYFATIEVEDPGYIELKIHPDGFTKEDFFELRDRIQLLEEGAEVSIAGNHHIVALFASRMIIDDHEIEEMQLTFEIDPFA